MINKYASNKSSFEKGDLIYFVNNLYDIPAFEIKNQEVFLNVLNVETNLFNDSAIMLSPSIGYQLWLDIKNKTKSIDKLQNFSKGVVIKNHDALYCQVLTENGKIGFVLREMCYSIDMFSYYEKRNFSFTKKYHGFFE